MSADFSTRSRFTLVELLAVMVIMVIIMGIAIPAFDKLTLGTGVDAAARMVGSQLRLTRQHAITKRKIVGLLLPRSEITSPGNVSYAAFRACEVDSTGAFVEWIQDAKWEYLPTGTIIAEADQDSGIDAAGPDDDSPTLVSGVPDSSGDVRAVVFRPTGRIMGLQKIVTIAEGVYQGGPQLKNDANILNITVDQYTGRVSFE